MKHEIEIPDFPEGWEPVAYRKPKAGEYYLTPDWITVEALHDYKLSHLIIRRKQVVEMPYKIRIPNLPEGWEPDTITFDKVQIEAMASCLTHEETTCTLSCRVLIRKKQPRRIVLEETGNIRQSCYSLKIDDGNLILPPGREYKIVDDKNETRD